MTQHADPEGSTDFAHAHAELSATAWIAHLAGGLAAASSLLAIGALVVGGRFYLQPLAEEGVVLPAFAQLVWRASDALYGPAAVLAALLALAGCFALWRRARRGTGGRGALFGVAALGLLITLVAVAGAALPVGTAQEHVDPAAESGR